ncbi:hypothetical protein ACVR0U_06150 [Streptococcus canis]|nr:hypothetical protein [Streptococcus canis]
MMKNIFSDDLITMRRTVPPNGQIIAQHVGKFMSCLSFAPSLKSY